MNSDLVKTEFAFRRSDGFKENNELEDFKLWFKCKTGELKQEQELKQKVEMKQKEELKTETNYYTRLLFLVGMLSFSICS